MAFPGNGDYVVLVGLGDAFIWIGFMLCLL